MNVSLAHTHTITDVNLDTLIYPHRYRHTLELNAGRIFYVVFSWLVLPLTSPLCPAPLPSVRSDEKLELQWNLEGHQLGVVSVDISHDGAIAASSSLDAHIRLWDLDSGKQIKSMDAGPGKTLRRAPVTL